MHESMVSNEIFELSINDFPDSSFNNAKDSGDSSLPANQFSIRTQETDQVEICQQTVNPHCKVSMDDFQIMKCIGCGGYGKVFLVRKVSEGRHHNRLFAMKVLKKAVICRTQKDMMHTWAERNILQMIRHPFLVKLYFAFQNESNLNLILEYCSGGELFNYLECVGFISEKKASFYLSEITLAIGHLHSLGIIYRDLKPENILLDREGHCKLADFGLSKEKCERTNTYCGTKEYMAPEIWLRRYHDKNVDWWSLGNLLYDMLVGYPPFSSPDKNALRDKILNEKPVYPQTFSQEAVSLVDGLLQKDPNMRLGSGVADVENIKQHPFFKKYQIRWSDVLERRMEPPYKPTLRSETDTSQFDSEFTSLAPVLSPVDPVAPDLFKGFSYVSSGVAESFLDNSSRGGYESRFKRRTPSTATGDAGLHKSISGVVSTSSMDEDDLPYHISIGNSVAVASNAPRLPRVTDQDNEDDSCFYSEDQPPKRQIEQTVPTTSTPSRPLSHTPIHSSRSATDVKKASLMAFPYQFPTSRTSPASSKAGTAASSLASSLHSVNATITRPPGLNNNSSNRDARRKEKEKEKEKCNVM